MSIRADNDWMETEDGRRYNVATGCRLEKDENGAILWYSAWTGGWPTTVPYQAWRVAEPKGQGERNDYRR